MTRFDQRTALVTGAAGDIGRAVAVRLATEGASLVLADHPAATGALDATAGACSVAGSPDVQPVLFDVTDHAAVEDVLAAAADAGPTPDLLFNNAGYQGAFANLVDVAADDVARVLDVNVKGVLSVLQVFARLLAAAERPGAVVNTASMAGVGGAPNMAAYSASKAAVIGLTKSAAKDLAPSGIRINAVSPAFIGPGAMWDNQVARQAEVPSIYYGDDVATVADEMVGQVPLRRYGSLEEVSSTVAFLLSDEASYLTGINIEIAGGAS